MSSNNGKAMFNLIACRIANIPTFYPAYRTQAGKDVSQRLRIPVAVNSRQGRVSYFDAICWGKRTVLAHYCSVGKELHLDGNLTSDLVPVKNAQQQIIYQKADGRQKDENGNPYPVGMDIPIRVPRVSLVIEGWVFGDDSANEKAKRPQVWETPGTPGNTAWKSEMDRIKAAATLPYQGGDTFGLAKVGAVNGTIMTQDANGNPIPLQTNLIHNPQMAGAGAAGGVNIPAPPQTGAVDQNAELLNGMRAAGWTDAQIAADPKYAYLLTQADIPAPPQTAAAGRSGV